MIRGGELWFLALYLLPTVIALADSLRITTDIWTAAKLNQVLWVVIILILPIVGAALYWFIARPRLKSADH